MEIIKKGIVKPERKFEGICSLCGVIIHFDESEIEWKEDRGQDYPYRKGPCPTYGCKYKGGFNLTELENK